MSSIITRLFHIGRDKLFHSLRAVLPHPKPPIIEFPPPGFDDESYHPTAKYHLKDRIGSNKQLKTQGETDSVNQNGIPKLIKSQRQFNLMQNQGIVSVPPSSTDADSPRFTLKTPLFFALRACSSGVQR